MYVIINGVSSETLQGVQILSLPPITKPRMRTSIATIDGRPGDIVTRLGYEAYNRKIEVLLHHTFDIYAVTAFFNQSGTIIFSNEPDMVYQFETIDAFDFERAVRFRTGTVTFHVQPYKLSATEEPATGEVSTLADRTPYIIRSTPFGTRQRGTIVGGSVTRNQIIENGDFADGVEKWDTVRATKSAADGVLTGTCNTDGTMYLMQNHASSQVGHVCFVCVDYMPSVTGVIACSITRTSINVNSVFIDRNVTADQWVHKEALARPNTAENGASGFRIGYTSNVAVGDTLSIKNVMLIDLTLMFGPTIADYIYTQEQASAGAGTALAKAWAGITDDYYLYDAGTIKSVTGLTAHRMTDGNGEVIGEYPLDSSLTLRGLPKLDEGSLYYDGDVYEGNKTGTITYNAVDMGTLPWFANGTSGGYYEYAVSIEDKAVGQYNVFCDIFPTAVGAGQPNTIRGLSSTTTISVLVAESSLEAFVSSVSGHKLCYELSSPMTQESGGAVTVRYAVTDLGSLNWTYSNSAGNPYFYSSNIPTKTGGNWNILCPKYALSSSGATTGMQDKEIKGHANSRAVFIKDSAYTDATTFKASLEGVLLLYELDAPFIISASPYTALQICDPAGMEEWVGASMPVGHETTYIDPISMTVTNEGNTESAPSITIAASGAIEVTVDGLIAFEISMPSTGTIVIDSAAMDAMDGDGNLANRSVSGDYSNLRLTTGEHTIIISGDAESVSLQNVSRWI